MYQVRTKFCGYYKCPVKIYENHNFSISVYLDIKDPFFILTFVQVNGRASKIHCNSLIDAVEMYKNYMTY